MVGSGTVSSSPERVCDVALITGLDTGLSVDGTNLDVLALTEVGSASIIRSKPLVQGIKSAILESLALAGTESRGNKGSSTLPWLDVDSGETGFEGTPAVTSCPTSGGEGEGSWLGVSVVVVWGGGVAGVGRVLARAMRR